MRTHPLLEYSLIKEKRPGRDVRHLLIQSVDGARLTNLLKLEAGVKTELASGTEYEMRKKAEALMREWVEKEGFKLVADSNKAYAPLEHTAALAALMGYTVVYDPTREQGINVMGATPLAHWPGMAAKNGGGYEYAFDGATLLAQPTLPPNHGLNMEPDSTEEFAAVMGKAIAILKTVGPHAQFVLG